MKTSKNSLLLASLPLLLLGLVTGCDGDATTPTALPAFDTLRFEEKVIDDRSGDVKMVGDLDGDGLPDLVIGGETREGLVWYRAPDWRPILIARPIEQFTTDAALGDVDGDGDLDIVTPDGPEGDNLVWYENPRPGGDPANGPEWKRRVVGSIGDWGKDVELADFDGDGRLDIATRSNGEVMIFFRNADGGWSRRPLDLPNIGQEGMGSGDIDGDGDIDLVVSGSWAENPGAAAARQPKWPSHAIGPAPGSFKALVADIDQDGQQDVLFSSSEDFSDIVLYTAKKGEPRGKWGSLVILPNVEKAHTLLAGDLDEDGDIDLIVGQMHTSADRLIRAVYNIDGRGRAWRVQVIGNTGVHNGVLADLEADGDLDLYGSNWVTNPPVRIWTNTLNPRPGRNRIDRWTRAADVPVEDPDCTLSLHDIDGDGRQDAVCGNTWWRNPAADLSSEWKGAPIPADGASAAKSASAESRQAPDLPQGFTFLESADMNGDETADAVARGPGGPSLFILTDNGEGRRGLQQIGAASDSGSGEYAAARVADLDGDGDLDIVTLVANDARSIRVWRNDAVRRD